MNELGLVRQHGDGEVGMFGCKYPGCGKVDNGFWDVQEYSGGYCIFHAPIDKEQEYPGKFEEELTKQIQRGDCNFEGYVFPTAYKFRKDFEQFADFRDVKFKAPIHFLDLTFRGKDNTGSFGDSVASFAGAQFGELLYFHDVRFERGVDFSQCEFNNQWTEFRDVQFSGRADFFSIKVNNGCLAFRRTKFISKWYGFFSGQVESGAVKIEEPTIQRGLDFDKLRFSDDSEFTFRNPKFEVDEITSPADIEKIPTIRFRNMKFVPFATEFEGMQHPPVQNDDKELNILQAPVMIFRYCRLQDVFFRDCNISLLSFYACPFFEEAHFISCTDKWRKVSLLSPILPKTTHRNIIFEDFLAKYLEKKIAVIDKEKMIDFYEVKDLLNYKELPTLYRRLKTASDRAKDYLGAGRFYFNEIETKRQAFLRSMKKDPVLSKKFYSFIKFCAYTAYRIFAGYGEKSFRGFDCFWIFTFAFALLHMLNGLSVPRGDGNWDPINYEWDLPFGWIGTFFTSQFWHDMGNCVLFSLYRVIPASYLPGLKYEMYIPDPGISDLALSFVNSFVLIMMIVFTGIGLKRHFRRF